jgi:hypothetical protein
VISRMEKKFKSKLEPRGPGGAWTFLRIPFDVNKAFRSKGRVSVGGTINDFRFRSSIFPEGDGTHILWVNKAIQKGAGVKPGDPVQVSLSQDLAQRVVAVPSYFKRALAHREMARVAFLKLSYSRKKDIVDHIRSAKTESTRDRRIELALKSLFEGRKRRS